MQQVVLDGTQDVTEEHNPESDRYIVLHEDGTFESGGSPHGTNTGRWAFDETARELYLDSDAGENDDSYWTVSFENGQMKWQGARFEFSKRFTIYHRR